MAIIQARMGSTRLPGKVLMDIAGKTMLERVLLRVRLAEGIRHIVVATSTLSEDTAIAEHCRMLGVQVWRGDPLDVLARYAYVAREVAASEVVRVTADCPFVDPGIISLVLSSLVARPGVIDYASNTLDPRTYPRGLDVEAFTAEVLFEADEADHEPESREHVTPYIYSSPRYRLHRMQHHEDLSSARWTVDTSADLQLARRMAEHFDGAVDTPWLTLYAAWRSHPEWRRLNAGVQQRTLRSLGP